VNPIKDLTPTTYYKVIIVGEELVNAVVEAGEFPLLFQTLTSTHCSWTMPGDHITGIHISEYGLSYMRHKTKFVTIVARVTALECLITCNERVNYDLFSVRCVRTLELVQGIAHLSDMPHGIRTSAFQENTVIIEDSVEVHPQKFGPTSCSRLFRKLTWAVEPTILHS
jgi:hypothetical protein